MYMLEEKRENSSRFPFMLLSRYLDVVSYDATINISPLLPTVCLTSSNNNRHIRVESQRLILDTKHSFSPD